MCEGKRKIQCRAKIIEKETIICVLLKEKERREVKRDRRKSERQKERERERKVNLLNVRGLQVIRK